MIRVFVGCAPNHEDAESQAVLEWSIRKHASREVEITWMKLSHDPDSPFYGWDTSRWATPFSGLRWCVPELCGYEGKAIYMDSDFIVLADIAELFDQEIKEPFVALGKGGNEWRMCCSVFDCERAQKHIPKIATMKKDSSVHGLLNQRFRSAGLVQSFDGDWNNLDGRKGESLSDIKALHYTDMRTQPQLEYALPRLSKAGLSHWYDGQTAPHPRQDVRNLFAALLREAADNGYTPDLYCQDELFGPVNKRSFARS